MLCDKCGKNNASVHFEQNINGQKFSMNLCSECAKQENIGYSNFGLFDEDFSFNNIFKGFFGGLGELPRQTKRCPSCSTSFSDIMNGGRLGCGECYNTFRNEIESAVKRFQPSVRHRGKFPGGTSAKKENNIEKLSAELQRAVNEEDYEKAAKLRDEIKKLRGEMQ